MNLIFSRKNHFPPPLANTVINAIRQEEADAVLFSGDLTTTSLESEFKKAADSFAPLYEKWGDQLIVIPGNHDRYTPSSVKAKYYEEYFPNAFAGMGSRVFSKPLNDHLCVIGFDASRPFMVRSNGTFTESLRKELEDEFSKIRKKATQKKDIKEGSYKVSIAGLPDMYMDDKTPGALLQKLRKIVKQPSMIKDVERTTTAKKRKDFRQKAQGREVAEYKYDYGTPESVKLMKKQTPGQNEGTDAPKGPESYEAQYKRRLVKTTDPEHKAKGFKYRIKGKKDSSLTKKLYKTKPGQAEFNKQMKRIAGHEFG